jgi:hypothetical protein
MSGFRAPYKADIFMEVIFSLLYLFRKMKADPWNLHAVRASVCPLINFGSAESIFMKLGINTMTAEKLTFSAYLNGVLHESLPPICVPVCVSLPYR